MQVLEKVEKQIIDNLYDISFENKEKIIDSRDNFLKTKKAYLIEDAYKIGLSKLNF